MVATIYQGNHDRKKQALGCRINLQIYTPYAGAARIHNWKIFLKSSCMRCL
jgi:hypothetical protein